MIKFEKVKRFANVDFDMPTRKTANSAGYDMVVAEDIVVPSFYQHFNTMLANADPTHTNSLEETAKLTKQFKTKPTLVSTGVKCYLEKGYYLELSVRSSTPLKYWLILANSVGIIDADYCDNPDNEGEIFFQVINLSPLPIELKRGDIIGQGIIKKYEVTDNDAAVGDRVGGFGSTSVQRGLRASAGLYEDAMIGYNDPNPNAEDGKTLSINFDFNSSKEDVVNTINKALKDEMRRKGVLV